jgi:hypothetical protein
MTTMTPGRTIMMLNELLDGERDYEDENGVNTSMLDGHGAALAAAIEIITKHYPEAAEEAVRLERQYWDNYQPRVT